MCIWVILVIHDDSTVVLVGCSFWFGFRSLGLGLALFVTLNAGAGNGAASEDGEISTP